MNKYFNTFLRTVIGIVVPESCLHYLTIDNWFHNFHLFDLQWTIWMYLLTHNLFYIQWFKEVKDFHMYSFDFF